MAEYNDWRPEESLTDAPRRGRDHGLDNVRFGLMFLVVFGHFLEIMPPFSGKQLLSGDCTGSIPGSISCSITYSFSCSFSCNIPGS